MIRIKIFLVLLLLSSVLVIFAQEDIKTIPATNDNMISSIYGKFKFADIRLPDVYSQINVFDWDAVFSQIAPAESILNTRMLNNAETIVAAPVMVEIILQNDPVIVLTDLPTKAVCDDESVAIANRFLTLNTDVKPVVLKVINELKRLNLQQCFIADIANNVGYPIWDKSITSTTNGHTTVYIPMAMDDSGYVDAIIEAKISREITIKLYRAGDYQQYLPGGIDTSTVDYNVVNGYALFFMNMQHIAMGTNEFKIIDRELFRTNNSNGNIQMIANIIYSGTESGSTSTTSFQNPSNIWIHDCVDGNDYEQEWNGRNYEYTGVFNTCTCGTVCGGGAPPPNTGSAPSAGGTTTNTTNTTNTSDSSTTNNGNSGNTGSTTSGVGIIIIPTASLPEVGGINIPYNHHLAGGGSTSTTTPQVTVIHPPGWGDASQISNHCPDADSLNRDTTWIKKMQDLQTKITENKEYAYTFSRDTSGILNTNLYQGDAGDLGVDPKISTSPPTDGFMHTHYNDSLALSVFSPDDIYEMALAFTSNKMIHPGSYIIAVVTDSTRYVLKIGDMKAFIKYATDMVNNNTLLLFSLIYIKNYKINSNNTIAENEKKFLQYLSQSKSGLQLYRGSSDCKYWQPLKLNSSNNVVDTPCPVN